MAVSGEPRLSRRRRRRRHGIWTSRLCICRIFPHFTFRYPIELLMEKKSRYSSLFSLFSLSLSLFSPFFFFFCLSLSFLYAATL